MLKIRKLADTSEGERVVRFDPITGEKHLVNPETDAREAWPLAGVQIVGDTPKACRVPTSFVTRGQAEGWIDLDGMTVVHRPGGPAEDPWRVSHTFLQTDAITIKTVDGDVRYRVVHQPDKYVVTSRTEGPKGEVHEHVDVDAPVTDEVYAAGDTRLDFFYDLALAE